VLFNLTARLSDSEHMREELDKLDHDEAKLLINAALNSYGLRVECVKDWINLSTDLEEKCGDYTSDLTCPRLQCTWSIPENKCLPHGRQGWSGWYSVDKGTTVPKQESQASTTTSNPNGSNSSSFSFFGDVNSDVNKDAKTSDKKSGAGSQSLLGVLVSAVVSSLVALEVWRI
jgi:hypothetical protein